MMRCVVVAAVVISLVGWGVSCVEKEPPSTQQPVSILSAPASPQIPQMQGQERSRPVAQTEPRPARTERQAESRPPAQGSAATPQVPPGAPVPPKGAQYTIFCGRVQGDAHVERANRVKNELISRTALNGFYVVHENQQSLLYYGFYRTFSDTNDRKETERAQSDLKRIKSLESDGNRLFAGAVFVDLEAPDPQAPPEWNLLNARGAWSLQIAAYKDSPLRKEAAVEAVREARAQGIEAYYYHGDAVSSVCIGAWPEHAVRVNDASTAKIHPQDEILVTAPGLEKVTGLHGKQGNLKVINEKVEIVDTALLGTMRQYPDHAVNGEVVVRRVNGREIHDPSLLIRIPSPDPAGAAVTSGRPAGYDPNAFRTEPMYQQSPRGTEASPREGAEPSRRAPPPPPQPGLGKLKSIDG